MIIFGNSTIIFKIFIYFAIPSLQSDTSLNNLKHKAMTGIGREACANHLTSHDVISLFFFYLYSFIATFLRRKKRCWEFQNSRKIFETHFESVELLIKLHLRTKISTVSCTVKALQQTELGFWY